MATFKTRFNFKSAILSKLLEAGATEASVLDPKQFDAVKDGDGPQAVTKYKRKSLDLELQEPAVLEGITDPLIKDLVLAEVKAFCKVHFVDRFLPIGEHPWEAITKWREETGRSAADDEISEEDRNAAAAVFRTYWQAQAKPAVAELFAELCKEGCGWLATKRLVTPKGKTITVEIVQRYVDKFTELANAMREDGHAVEADRLDALAAVLAGHITKRFDTVDPASSW